MPRLDLPGVRRVDAGQDLQQWSACPVEAGDDDLRAAVDRQIDVGEPSVEPYDRDNPLARSGVRPLGPGREAQLGHPVVLALPLPPASIRSARRIMFCAAVALVALARIFSAWSSGRRLLLGVGVFAFATPLVEFALLEIEPSSRRCRRR